MSKKRAGSGMTLGQQESNPGVDTGSREDNAHGINRHNRVSIGGAGKNLTIPVEIEAKLKAEGHFIYWGLDDGRGQIQRLINAGYEYIADEQGNNIYVNSGGRNQYAMFLPKQWRDDDLRLKKKKASANLGVADDKDSSIELDGAVSSKESDNPYTA